MNGWTSYKNGSTIGTKGSENGKIIFDEEYLGSCRITLEETKAVPYSITCGVYGMLCHTVFADTPPEAKQKYEGIKQDLKAFIDSDMDDASVMIWVENFIEKW